MLTFSAGTAEECPIVNCLKLKLNDRMDKQDKKKDKGYNRRDFINNGVRLALGVSVVGTGAFTLQHSSTTEDYVWQIDPFLCNQCGRCATDCVKSDSAVKCVHAYDLCGYCDLCGGYLKPGAARETGGESQLCPTSAITRSFIENPYFEYVIDEDLCIGCAKCVKGCSSFGNGSLHLQIRHNLCLNCNQCSIARVCPTKAISRVPASEPYKIKGSFTQEEG